MTKTSIARGSRAVNGFSANAALRGPLWRLHTHPQFQAFPFPPATQELDRFSGIGKGDLLFLSPIKGGGLIVIVPVETARNWQREARHLTPDVIFATAAANSLTISDLEEILKRAGSPSGHVIDVLVLRPDHREMMRKITAPWLTNGGMRAEE